MTKSQLLNNLLADLAGMTGQATSKEQALKLDKPHYLNIEYNSSYGGYRLINVNTQSGGHSGAFGDTGCEDRLNAKSMEVKLRSLITGLEYARTNKLYS